jgi:hypothetical protein
VVAALLIALAATIAAASSALAFAQVRRIAAACALEPHQTAIALLRVPPGERAAELVRRAPEGSWERVIGAALGPSSTGEGSPGDDASRIATVNDVLADVARELEAGAAWPKTAFHLAVLATVLDAVLAFLVGAKPAIPGILCVGALGAVLALEAGRRARRSVAGRRAGIDELVAVLVPPDPTSGAVRASLGAGATTPSRTRDRVRRRRDRG